MNKLKKVMNFNSTPIWFMRQAGRYMYEYNAIKKKFKCFFEMCKNVEAVTDITLLPIKKFDFDAAIIFSDILIILNCLKIKVEFIKNRGPVVYNNNLKNIFSEKNYDKNIQELFPVYQSIKTVKRELRKFKKPLIGFSGAPWTVAAYLLEGTLTRDLSLARKTAYREPKLVENIISVLTEIIQEHIINQIENGADLIQIFDTHSNVLDFSAKKKYSVKPIKEICEKVKSKYPDIPISYFSKDVSYDIKGLLDYIDIISFSSAVRMKNYLNIFPKNLVFQGNLDPVKLLVGGDEMKKSVIQILKDMKEKDFIFNLGHGILPETPRENVVRCVNLVKKFKY